MKNRFGLTYSGLVAGLVSCVLGLHRAQGAPVALQLEESADLVHWTPVPAAQLPVSPGGAWLLPGDKGHVSYRLRISDGAGQGAVPAMPLELAPKQAVELARAHLAQFGDSEVIGERDSEPGWAGAGLGPICYPVYDPAVDGGRSPAYIEFKVIAAPPPGAGRIGFSRPPTGDETTERGYLLVSLHAADFPIAGFAEAGPTQVEMLLRRVRGGKAVKPMRMDDTVWVGEDADGNAAASLGSAPYGIDDGIMEMAGIEAGGEIPGATGGALPVDPEFKTYEWRSYADFRKDIVERPLYKRLRAVRQQLAKKHWDLANGVELKSVSVAPGASVSIFENALIVDSLVEDPAIASLRVGAAGGGGTLVGLKEGQTVVTVTLSDGSLQACLVFVGTRRPPASRPQLAGGGWTGWTEYYAASYNEQRRYTQELEDSSMCPDGASGCGPTAWAMLYGWWDRQSVPKLMADAGLRDAPLKNNSAVVDCLRYVWNRVGTFCVVTGQGATTPWEMKKGYQWCDFRGAQRQISYKWGFPGLCPEARDKASSSVKNGKPSIIGIGFYWHYPMAYGYKYRKWKDIFGTVWDIQRYYKCNMGWGWDHGEWRNADSIWFATDARFF